MPLSTGTRLGPYEILAAIGSGGMGEVYRARDTRLDRDVALKILPDAFAADPERLARFEREAKTLASLNHPNVAHIYGLEERALVIELVAGEDLSQRVARGPVPVADALAIARQIAEAIEAAHEQGIVHRDLKPANVKVRHDGRVKVLDFGLAKALGADGTSASAAALTNSPTVAAHAMTAPGIILGTAAYMSPEQARGMAIDTRSDIWAFGCVVYETLTGTPAFEGNTLTDVLAAVVRHEPDWTALPPDTPRAVRTLLRRCLQKDPTKRLRDIGDARLEIQDAMAGPESHPVATDASHPPPRWKTRIPWIIAALAVAALILSQAVPFRPTPAPAPPASLEMNLPPGVEPYVGPQGIAFSPDGTKLAFIGTDNGYRRVYIRRLNEFGATALEGTLKATGVFFSPNGNSIAAILSTGVLETVSLDDGNVTPPLATNVNINYGGVWGPDNSITVVRDNVLWQVPASGEPAQLTTLANGEVRHAFPAVVAGGKALLFAVVTGSRREEVHLESLTLATKERHQVVSVGTNPLYAPSGHLIFSRARSLLAIPFDAERLVTTGPERKMIDALRVGSTGSSMVAISNSGALAYMSGTAVSQLVWVSRGSVEQAISDFDQPYQFPQLRPGDRSQILVAASGDLRLRDTVGGPMTALNTAITTGNAYSVWVPPDGKRFVFRALTGLYQMDAESGQPRIIAGTSDSDYPSSITPDGETLLFVRTSPDTSGDIYALSLHGESNPHAVVQTSAYDGGPQVSPDGHWLLYTSDGPGSDPDQVFVSPFPGAETRWPVSQSGKYPRWTKGGTEVVYRDAGKMMAVAVSYKNGVPTFKQPQTLFDDRYQSGPSTSIPFYDVTPDGDRFVMVKAEPGSSRLNVVLNWLDELRRRVPPAR